MATPFLKRGFYGKPIGMWGPNPNRNPNYGGPWLWRAVTVSNTLSRQWAAAPLYRQ